MPSFKFFVICSVFPHCTVTFNVKLWVNVAEPDVTVPVTVSEYVPAGVPGLCVMAAPPPPQPGTASATSSKANNIAAPRRNLIGSRHAAPHVLHVFRQCS